jgi:hypothetical protein
LGLRQEPAATRSGACGQEGMTSSREMAVLLRATPSTARIDPVIRCRSRMFFATTCVRMLAPPGGEAHSDDFWHRQEARQDGGVGLTDPQGHERDELVAEGAEVKPLAEGFERAVSGEIPQPGVDSQEPGEGEPFGIGARPTGSWGAARNETAFDAWKLQKSSPDSSRSPAWSGRGQHSCMPR